MGILTRQQDNEWILEVKEKFFCTAREAAMNIQELLLDLKLNYEVDVENYHGQEYITLELNNASYSTTDFNKCLENYKRLMHVKNNFGQKPKAPLMLGKQ